MAAPTTASVLQAIRDVRSKLTDRLKESLEGLDTLLVETETLVFHTRNEDGYDFVWKREALHGHLLALESRIDQVRQTPSEALTRIQYRQIERSMHGLKRTLQAVFNAFRDVPEAHEDAADADEEEEDDEEATDLTCGICLSIYTDPMLVLDSGVTYCRACLEGWIRDRQRAGVHPVDPATNRPLRMPLQWAANRALAGVLENRAAAAAAAAAAGGENARPARRATAPAPRSPALAAWVEWDRKWSGALGVELRDKGAWLFMGATKEVAWRGEFGDAGAGAVAEAIKASGAIERVELVGNMIANMGALALAAALRDNGAIREVTIGDNMVHDDGVRALAFALRGCPRLHTVVLRNNAFGKSGATALARVLRDAPALSQLDISDNYIGDAGAKACAEGLQDRNWKLPRIHLKMNNTGVGNAGAKRLADVAGKCTVLRSLALGKNAIGAAGAKELAEALKNNLTVKDVSVVDSDCDIDVAWVPEVFRADERVMPGVFRLGQERTFCV
ncbi:unnamed protein product [Pedinophyceae sp. YPF-701]|nr:unnamed protein product [Pedinophyceae sp. YPF-701]